jgi:hypothetical protein
MANLENIKLARQVLASVPDERVELRFWQSKRDPFGYIHPVNSAFDLHENPKSDCGTFACGGGWLALSPEFQALGLVRGYIGKPRYGDAEGAEAFMVLFDLTLRECWELFDGFNPSSNPLDCEFARTRGEEPLSSELQKELLLFRFDDMIRRYEPPAIPD